MMSKNGSRSFALLIFESWLTCLCGIAAIFIRFNEDAIEVLIQGNGWLKILLLMLVVQGAFYISDLYDFRMIRNRTTLYLRILQAIGLAAIVLAVIFYALPQLMLGRGVFLVSLILMLTMMICWRIFVMWLIGHPRLSEQVLILGTEESAINVAREVLERQEGGYQIVGFVGDDPGLIGKSLINPRVIGLTSDLATIVEHYHVDRIVVSLNDRRKRLPYLSLLELRLRDGIAIEESTTFYERLTGKIPTELLRPSWLIFSNHSRLARMYKHGRRLLDIIAAAVGVVLSLPVMLITAILIKLNSRGPIFYTQERVGKGDQVFTIVKFRSMTTDAEKNGPVWARESDSRVTRVGRIIRKLRIDEIPQFFNVLRGDMSLIGPRPERPQFVEMLAQEIPFYSQRHLIKPGLTGWAQIRYPYGASVKDAIEKFQYDLYYIKNQSPVLDLIIVFETIRIVIFGRGAR
ncbi:MAG: TIGR03013 family XrtA/PEP-CTERM system glycosyltransferase [Acidobacteriota bacterium]